MILFAIFSATVCCIIYSCQSEGEIEQAKYLTSGKDIYIKNCQNCHGTNGEGLGELAPPLTDTVFLKTNKAQLACIIKNGSNKGVVILVKSMKVKCPNSKKCLILI
ncbi:c-type cytochrome [Pedobacter sp. UC225_65]|uniref:c-type cytochrome n=1 Tax=Pedobacter sp. UC225_65 TaxID=3350173 RepID=UPI003672D1EB